MTFYLGGYENFDNFALRCCKQYKLEHENATLVFVTPYLNQRLDTRRDCLKSEYDEILYPPIENVPLKLAILKRKDLMVDCSDFVVTFINVRFGGAYSALMRALKKSKDFVNVAKNFNLT